jgi:hypothetical protein
MEPSVPPLFVKGGDSERLIWSLEALAESTDEGNTGDCHKHNLLFLLGLRTLLRREPTSTGILQAHHCTRLVSDGDFGALSLADRSPQHEADSRLDFVVR